MSIRQNKSRRAKIAITDRDYNVLRFLWKWKIVSTAAVARKFFSHIKPLSAYRRLQYLETDGYIKMVQICNRRDEAWQLTDRGFKYILPKLGELMNKGHRSENIYHDFLTTSFHLGEWLTHQPKNSQSYSEQQLRRYPQDAWPEWVPRSGSHRPDGFSIYKTDNQIITAFEVELSIKNRERYGSVVAYYDSQTSIDVVCWLINSNATLRSISKSFEQFQIKRREIHHFVMLSAFLQNGWRAPFITGHYKGSSIFNLLQEEIVLTSNWHPKCDTLSLLECRRRPIIPNDWSPAANTQKP